MAESLSSPRKKPPMLILRGTVPVIPIRLPSSTNIFTTESITLIERVVVVCSIESAGATSLIHSLTMETMVDIDSGAFINTAIRYPTNRMISFMPQLYKEGTNRIYLSFIDAKTLEDNKGVEELKEVLSRNNFASCAMIVVKIYRWGISTFNKLIHTIENLKKLNFTEENICLVVGHMDCLQNKINLISSLKESLLEQKINFKHIIGGCFLRFKNINEQYYTCYSNFWQETWKCFYEKIIDFKDDVIIPGIRYKPFNERKAELQSFSEIKRNDILQKQVPDHVGLTLTEIYLRQNNVKNLTERNIIFLGMTGVGKSAIINSLKPNDVKEMDSKVSIKPVTIKCKRLNRFQMIFKEFDDLLPYDITLVDTIGLGDVENKTDDVIDQIKYFVMNEFKVVDLVCICVSVNMRKDRMQDIGILCDFLKTAMEVTNQNTCFIITHTDFYSKQFIDNFKENELLLVPSVLDLINNTNIICGCTINPNEVSDIVREHFSQRREDFLNHIRAQFAMIRPRIDAANNLTKNGKHKYNDKVRSMIENE
jgi:GTP-binding protein EngB required for normal cell division